MADFTRCRTYGHAWFEADSDWIPDWGTPLTLRCERCLCERRDTIGSDGELARRRYIHPSGYQYSGDEVVPTKDEFRLALLALRLREARARKRNTA